MKKYRLKHAFKITATTFAFSGLLFWNSDASATSIAVNDWYAINNVSPVPNPAPVFTDGNTENPTYENAMANNIWAFSYFDSTTVLDGQTLSISFDLTLDLAQATQGFGIMAFGLLKSSDLKATISRYGTDRITTTTLATSTIMGWEGFILKKRSPQFQHKFEVYRKTGDDNVNLVGHDDADITKVLASNTGNYSLNFSDDVTRSFTFTLKRVGDDLYFSGSVGNGQDFAETLIENGFAGGYNVFDAFGFYASGGGTINSGQFSNVSLTLIPEPSSIVLLLMPLLALGVRRSRCA